MDCGGKSKASPPFWLAKPRSVAVLGHSNAEYAVAIEFHCVLNPSLFSSPLRMCKVQESEAAPPLWLAKPRSVAVLGHSNAEYSVVIEFHCVLNPSLSSSPLRMCK